MSPMIVAPAILVDTPAALRPEQLLAAAVIHQAIVDATNPHRRPHARRSAALFLTESTGLHFWAAVLGLDPSLIGARCRHLLAAK